jgi:hypothetical protein
VCRQRRTCPQLDRLGRRGTRPGGPTLVASPRRVALHGQQRVCPRPVTPASSGDRGRGVLAVVTGHGGPHPSAAGGCERLPCLRGQRPAPVPHHLWGVHRRLGRGRPRALRALPRHLRLDHALRRPPRGRQLCQTAGARPRADQERDLEAAGSRAPTDRLTAYGTPCERAVCESVCLEPEDPNPGRSIEADRF